MVKRVRAILVLAVMLTAVTRASDDLTVGLDEMVRDGPDRLVAFSRAWNRKLAVFEDGHWKALPVLLPGGSVQPRALANLSGGRLASLWAADQGEWIVAVLEQGRIVRMLPFSWPVGSWDRLDFQAGANDTLWLSGEDPRVVRLSLRTGEVTVFDLSPHVAPGSHKKWNAAGVVEDGQGGTWIWSRHRADNYFVAAGLFRVKGNELEPVPKIEGFAGRRILDLAPRDAETLWVFDRVLGLFVLHLRDLRVEPVEPPEKNAFRSSFAIFPLQADWLVLTGSGSRQAVWRLAGRDWTKIFPEGACSFIFWDRPGPASAEVASGRLLAANEGVLFVPKDGAPPRLLDWKSGFPLTAPRQILALDGDRFAAISGSGSPPRWIMAELAEYLSSRKKAPAEDITPWRGWAVDAEERVYTLLRQNPAALSMWDDGEWHEIPLPEGIKRDQLNHVTVDARNRVWVFTDHVPQAVAVLETDRKTWRVAADFRTALREFRDGLENFLTGFAWLRPIPGPDGKIAFRTPQWTIEAWDGTAWRTWKLDEIVRPKAMTLNPADSPVGTNRKDDRVSTPFFDAEGRLCVNTLRSESTWKLGEDGSWTPKAKEPGITDMWTNNQPNRVERKLPAGFPHRIKEPWVAVDNVGSTWVAGNGNLFRHRGGKTIAVFDEGSAHPFLANPQIGAVRVDRRGYAWIKMGLGNATRHVLVPTRTEPPPLVKCSVDAWGFATLASRPAGVDLEWKINDGPWRVLPPDALELGYLPPGPSRIGIRLVDGKLSVRELEPIEVRGRHDGAGQLAHLVGVLADGPGDRREFAVAALEANPEAALPVLDQALRKNPADSWWLEAARQACERAAGGR